MTDHSQTTEPSGCPVPGACSALVEIDRLRAQILDLKQSVIAFGTPWMVRYAEDWCMPKGHLDPTHYDILKRAGARMDDFIRGSAENAG